MGQRRVAHLRFALDSSMFCLSNGSNNVQPSTASRCTCSYDVAIAPVVSSESGVARVCRSVE